MAQSTYLEMDSKFWRATLAARGKTVNTNVRGQC
jgi:hypothetical protein